MTLLSLKTVKNSRAKEVNIIKWSLGGFWASLSSREVTMNELSKTLSLLIQRWTKYILLAPWWDWEYVENIIIKHHFLLQHNHPGYCSAEVLVLSAPAESCLGMQLVRQRSPLLVDAKLCPWRFYVLPSILTKGI